MEGDKMLRLGMQVSPRKPALVDTIVDRGGFETQELLPDGRYSPVDRNGICATITKPFKVTYYALTRTGDTAIYYVQTVHVDDIREGLFDVFDE